jgi:hypothetical protein
VSNVYVTAELARVLTSSESGLKLVDCPRCGQFLSLHQPDMLQPDLNLGTCCDCQAWFLIGHKAGVMVLLPDEDELGRLGSDQL